MEEPDESASLARIAGDLERAGYPNLAHVVELRSLWDEPLFLGVVEYFLSRSLPNPADSESESSSESSDSWRCLEMTACLLEEREEEIEQFLDRREETDEPAEAAGPDANAITALYQQGLSCSRRGDHRKAVTHFTAALKLSPTNALLYHQRGEAYRLLCKYQRAIADFQVAARLSPQSPSILTSRASAYHLGGEHARAVADCNSAVALDPDHTEAHRIRARASAELGNNDRAIADLGRVIELGASRRR